MKTSLNDHNKTEYPPMHTVEHTLNQTMIRLFGGSRNTHIERKKSKCDYTDGCLRLRFKLIQCHIDITDRNKEKKK
ncbi:MAG: hypothetical protein LBQ78_08230 [Tannerellaceae bacterium]|nr:hypothetical protein [Tannerellaceae bacterium]